MNDLAPWREAGKITKAQFESAMEIPMVVKYQIIDNKLYRGGGRDGEGKCTFSMRCDGIDHMLLEMLKKYELKKDIEFALNDFDNPKVSSRNDMKPALFSFSKATGVYNDILYPCWAFWKGGPCVKTEPKCLGRWDLKIKSMGEKAEEFPWDKKENIAFFRGSRTSNERDPLALLGVKYPDMVCMYIYIYIIIYNLNTKI